MAKIADVFPDIDDLGKGWGDFDTLPDGTMAVAKVIEVTGKQNRNGAMYGAVVIELTHIPAGLTGNFRPRIWDYGTFTTPGAVDPTLPEDEATKARKKAGMWARRVTALGLNPKEVDTDWDAAQVGAFYLPAVGVSVIVRLGFEPADGQYRAKNTARDYFPDTDAMRVKHHLSLAVDRAATFEVEL